MTRLHFMGWAIDAAIRSSLYRTLIVDAVAARAQQPNGAMPMAVAHSADERPQSEPNALV